MGCIRVRVDGAVGANGAIDSIGIGVAVTHGVEGHGQVMAAAGQSGITALRLGGVEQREDPLRGGHAVHRHMEIRPQLAQRQEEAAERNTTIIAPVRSTPPTRNCQTATPMPAAVPP